MRPLLLHLNVKRQCICCSDCLQEGLAFLEENKQKEGVVTLPSGLQYKVIKSGDANGPSPSVDTPCRCHYSGTTIKVSACVTILDRQASCGLLTRATARTMGSESWPITSCC